MNTVLDYVLTIGCETFRDRLRDVKDNAAIRDILKEFLEKQQKSYFSCTREEEVDFKGLSDYIRTDLLDDVRLRLFGNEAERGYARDRIITNAIGYAQANTQLSKDRVKKTIGKAVDLLHEFYRRNIKNDLLFITSEITDSVASTVIEQNREQTRVLFEKIDQISGSAVLSIDKKRSLNIIW